jgi:cell division protein FtsX
MPNIKENLQKFNIDNPLYSTLYIKISDKDNYKTIKNILNENKDKIQNYEDFDIDNFNSQEQRSIQTITVSNFIQKVIITFSIILILIIVLFITHIIYSLYKHFEKDLSSKKML